MQLYFSSLSISSFSQVKPNSKPSAARSPMLPTYQPGSHSSSAWNQLRGCFWLSGCNKTPETAAGQELSQTDTALPYSGGFCLPNSSAQKAFCKLHSKSKMHYCDRHTDSQACPAPDATPLVC